MPSRPLLGNTLHRHAQHVDHFEHEFQEEATKFNAVSVSRVEMVFLVLGAVAFFAVTVAVIVLDVGTYKIGADDTPAHSIFVGSVQLVLFLWILVMVTEIYRRTNIPLSLLFNRAGKGQPQDRVPILHADLDLGTQHNMDKRCDSSALAHNVRVFAITNSFVLVVAVTVYTNLCWGEARDQLSDCQTGSPVPIEFASIVLLLVPLMLPWPLPGWRLRKTFWWRLLQCLACVVGVPALSFEVKFIHVLITDVLTSSCLFLWDMEYAICLFSTSSWTHGQGQEAGQGNLCGPDSWNHTWLAPFVIVCPFWLRFVQSVWIAVTKKEWKSAANALKYLSAIAVVGTSAAGTWDPQSAGEWFWAWIVALIVKTTFCYYWDVVHDWGLVAPVIHASKGVAMNFRQLNLYPTPYYVVAAIFNLFGRVSWALAISPQFCNSTCRLVLGLFEMLRRGVWLVLRVEYATIHKSKLPSFDGLHVQSFRYCGWTNHDDHDDHVAMMLRCAMIIMS
eukprot:m.89061 g.89061  ORF g.89061 m.89061 type:complete len:503 (+) comp26257_c0_seq6:406-1914(+)